MSTLDRRLVLSLDEAPLPLSCRLSLQGCHTLNLFPDLFQLQAWNLSESTYRRFLNGKEFSVSVPGTSGAPAAASQVSAVLNPASASGTAGLLVSGQIADVTRHPTPDGSVTSVTFSPGLSFWESAVALTVPAGASASETLRMLLAASGTGVSLLAFPAEDPVFARPQTFFGRTAEAVEAVLSACSPRPSALLTPAGLTVVSVSEALSRPASLILRESDLSGPPVEASAGLLCRMPPAAWPLGTAVEILLPGGKASGLLTRHRIEADTGTGPWYSELEITERSLP